MSKRKSKETTPVEILKKLKSLEKQVLEITTDKRDDKDFVYFKVGTQYFTTLRSTIEQYPESMLYLMVNGKIPSRKVNEAIFIDMSPKRFEVILDYIRTMIPPAMNKQQQENFETDLVYFQLPFQKPLTPAEKKWMEQVEEWLGYEQGKNDSYYWEIVDETHPLFNESHPVRDVYHTYVYWCSSVITKALKIEQFSYILKNAGCTITDSKFKGIHKHTKKFDKYTYDEWHKICLCICIYDFDKYFHSKNMRKYLSNLCCEKYALIIDILYCSDDDIKIRPQYRFLKTFYDHFPSEKNADLKKAILDEWKQDKSMTTALKTLEFILSVTI